MANYKKSFNFRNGVQVDYDNFVVNPNGLVGIGTSIPKESLDIVGNAKIIGIVTTINLGVADTSNFYGDLNVGNSITLDPLSGDVIAARFVGDASGLQNIFAISTTGWIALGVGLHTFRSVGVGTTNPEYFFQVQENPAFGIGVAITNGNIYASGLVSATSFTGDITGNLFGDVTGDLTGVASTATKLQNPRTFTIVGDLESNSVSFDGTSNVSLESSLSESFSANTSGIITASSLDGKLVSTSATITTGIITNAFITNLDVGIGTFDSIIIDKINPSNLIVSSETNSTITIGSSLGIGNSISKFVYTPGSGRLDISNYDIGGVSINLHEGNGVGVTEGFSVRYDNTKNFEVTYDGKVGINRGGAPLTRNFEVNGDIYINGNSEIVGVLTIGTGSFKLSLGDGSPLPVSQEQNFNTLVGVTTFNNLRLQSNLEIGAGSTIVSGLYVGGEVGIGTTNNSIFVIGNQSPKLQIFGAAYASDGFVCNGTLCLTKDSTASTRQDPRDIPNAISDIVPFMSYGEFQVESGSSSLITENLLIVPTVGVITDGFGYSDLGLISQYDHPDYSTSKYLSKVGINTYFARSIFDVGTGSTTMNSYFIPPSLSQNDINIMSDLWNPSTSSNLTGHVQARKVTPNGLIPGSIVYNKTTDELQVSNGQSSFRNISPVKAFATVNSGTLVSTDGYNLSLDNNLTNAIFSFETALQTEDYTVIVSCGSTTQSYTVPEAQKSTTGFRVTFSPSNADTQSYTVMILQI